MKIIQESCPTASTSAIDAHALALAFPVANAEGKFVCPCDGKVYGSLKSLRNHLSTAHREDYTAARERVCGQVVPGPLPTEEQLVAWRRNPVVGRGAAGLLMFDASMLAGIRVAPGGKMDIQAVIARFTGCSEKTASQHLDRITTIPGSSSAVPASSHTRRRRNRRALRQNWRLRSRTSSSRRAIQRQSLLRTSTYSC